MIGNSKVSEADLKNYRLTTRDSPGDELIRKEMAERRALQEAETLLRRLLGSGMKIEVYGQTMEVSPQSFLTAEDRRLIRMHRARLIAFLKETEVL
jgi:hypothetical protein